MSRTGRKARVNEIYRKLSLMSNLVEKQIYRSMEFLRSHNLEGIEKVFDEDDKVDAFQKEIEEECIKFIATRQPLAKDLRNVFTVTKIATDLERMADHAIDICKICKKVSIPSASFPKEVLALWEMEEQVRKMINLSVDAFVKGDIEQAYDICKMDDFVDRIYASIFDNMLKILKSDESKTDTMAQLLFVAKYLERIGDRVTNICEGIIYSIKGTYVDLNE
ncbi:MAG: phosphate signaling complex protein PhoU [Clostridiaceae bacterium]|nr:phosphate signaling complex protein PhoU [Clostridiaceae bacterium]